MSKHKLPSIGKIVIAKCIKIESSTVVCELVEYNNLRAYYYIFKKRKKYFSYVINKNYVFICKSVIHDTVVLSDEISDDLYYSEIQEYKKRELSKKILTELSKKLKKTNAECKKIFGWKNLSSIYSFFETKLGINPDLTYLKKIDDSCRKDVLKILSNYIRPKKKKFNRIVTLRILEKEGVSLIRSCFEEIFSKLDDVSCKYLGCGKYLIQMTENENAYKKANKTFKDCEKIIQNKLKKKKYILE